MSAEFSARYQETNPCRKPNVPKACEDNCYEEMVANVYQTLRPGDIITPRIAEEANLRVLLLGNKNLRADYFDVKYRDVNPLRDVSYPGKSAHIDFLQADRCSKEEAQKAVQLIFGTQLDRRDALYAARIEDIDQIGYLTFLAPMHAYPLHLRLVHQDTISGGPVPLHAKQQLRDIFERIYPYRG